MKRRKYIKQLMALGVQRNDAAGFVSTCWAITAAGKEHLLPVIMQAPIPTIRTDYQVQKFATTVRYSDKYDFHRVPADLDDPYVYKELAREMGLALLDAGAIKVTRQELPPDRWSGARCVEYRATIKVAREAGI